MTKAQIIVISKKVALAIGWCYQEDRMKFCTKKECWEGLVNLTAAARAARGKLKTAALNQNLSSVLELIWEVPNEP